MDNDDSESSESSEDSSSSSSSADSGSIASGNEESISSGVESGETNEAPKEEDEYAAAVRLWMRQVPIGLGLCPWAIKSKAITFETCHSTDKDDVIAMVLKETKELSRDGLPSLSTTLIVCPNVTDFQDFGLFEDFVNNFREIARIYHTKAISEGDLDLVLETITLVSFHPNFLKWRGLPEGIQIGSAVNSHRAIGGFQKTPHKEPATLLETSNKVFGRRKLKLRFHRDDKEQYIPVNWFAGDGPPLPDNAMHRSPYPTIHLIRNQDLGSLRARDVSRVKRINAKRMTKLGWEGVQRKLSPTQADQGTAKPTNSAG